MNKVLKYSFISTSHCVLVITHCFLDKLILIFSLLCFIYLLSTFLIQLNLISLPAVSYQTFPKQHHLFKHDFLRI